jgi:hypothetical protein
VTLCAACAAGNHPHDAWPDGSDASCPNLAAGYRNLDDVCTCPVRLPATTPAVHRCACGHVHQEIR